MQKSFILKTISILFIFSIIVSTTKLYAQNNRERWLTTGMSGRISSKWNVSLSRQYSLNDSLNFTNYYLDDIRLTRNINKYFDVFGAWSYLVVEPSSDKTPTVKQRATLGLGLKANFLGFKTLLRTAGERHFQEKKYDARIVTTGRIEYADFEIGDVDIRPFVIGQLYYHIGGDSIKQFNEAGKFVGQEVPYGWHRSRVRAGLTVVPTSWLQLGIFYLWQTEFNTADAVKNNHRINVYNPETKKVTRAFDNYQAFGASLTFVLGGKKSHKEHATNDEPN